MKACFSASRYAGFLLLTLSMVQAALGSQSAVEAARAQMAQVRSPQNTAEARAQALLACLPILTTADVEAAADLAEEVAGAEWMSILPASKKAEIQADLAFALGPRGLSRAVALAEAAANAEAATPETQVRALRAVISLRLARGEEVELLPFLGRLTEAESRATQPSSKLEARAARFIFSYRLGSISDEAAGEEAVDLISKTRGVTDPFVLGVFGEIALGSAGWIPALAKERHKGEEAAALQARRQFNNELVQSLLVEGRERLALARGLYGDKSSTYVRLSRGLIAALIQNAPLGQNEELRREARSHVDHLKTLTRWVAPLDHAMTLALIGFAWSSADDLEEARSIVGRMMDEGGATIGEAQSFLLILGPLAIADPAESARRWVQAASVFAESVTAIAAKDPQAALGNLQAWSLNWTFYKPLAARGQAEGFLDGYTRMTGIVRNLPFEAGEQPVQEQRLSRTSFAEVRARTYNQSPLVVYVQFQEPNILADPGASYGAFLVQGDAPIRFADLGPAAPIHAAIARWGQSVRGPLEEARVGDPRQTGAELYRMLLRPLFGDRPPARLTYVPDGQLMSLSLSSLVAPSGKWLVEHTVLTTLGAVRDLIPPDEPLAAGAAVLSGVSFANEPRLAVPFRTSQALKRISPNVKSGTLSPVAGRTISPPRFLHVSTHGRFDPARARGFETQATSSLLVAPGKDEDKVILAKDVAAWKLRGTKLVTLAVCDAAAAETLKGEGSGGLRRGLALAGARHVVGSLRPVYAENAEEAPGDAFFARLYTAIAGGRTPAEALRQAQLVTLRRPATAAPHFWAGYLIEGA